MNDAKFRYPIWVRGDLDGFFGLMIDNLVQVLMIIELCKYVAGLPDSLIYTRVLPGVGVSLLLGNIFYGLQAHYVARKQRNPECTALPYGINTPSVIAYLLFIMAPVYKATGDGNLAWVAGLMACLVSGVVEFIGAFFAEKLRRITPRAALLGVLAAIGITFIAGDFAFQIFTSPLVSMLPLAFLLLAYFAYFKFPCRLPGGFLAILFGSLIAWGSTWMDWDSFGGVKMSAAALGDALGRDAATNAVNCSNLHFIKPQFVGVQIWEMLRSNPNLILLYLTVSVPMGIINVLGSLQNIESADAGGDRFATGPSLAVNGLGTIAAGLFGSCFPTTIYIGHPGWKALGARSGYSILNGLFYTCVFFFGLGPFLSALIPVEAGAAIVLYIGIIITAQAFQVTPRKHAPAVAVALFPGMAAIVLVKLGLYFDYSGVGVSLLEILKNPSPSTADLPGLLAITGANSGWFISTLILAAAGAALIDKKYRQASIWMVVATVLTFVGAIHAYRLEYRDNTNVIREYFIWQHVDYPHYQELTFTDEAQEPADAPPESPKSQPVETQQASGDASPVLEQTSIASSAAASESAQGIAYRAYPIAIGYALAAILFGAAAMRQKHQETHPPIADSPLPPDEDEEPTGIA